MYKVLCIKYKGKNRGFTLVEMLIYMGIFSIMLIALTQIFTSIIDVQLESQSNGSVSQDGQYILSRLTYDIQRAQDIATPSAQALGTPSSTLGLVINDVNGTSYTYASSSGNLVVTNNLGTNQLNGYDTSLSEVSFTRLGNSGAGNKNTITFSFTLTSKTARNSVYQSRTFQSSIGLR